MLDECSQTLLRCHLSGSLNHLLLRIPGEPGFHAMTVALDFAVVNKPGLETERELTSSPVL
jgi:hypothetical protein